MTSMPTASRPIIHPAASPTAVSRRSCPANTHILHHPVPPCAALCRPVPCVRRERLRSVVLRSHILNLEYSQSINTRIPEGPNTGLIRECKTDRVRAGATHTVCAIPANPKRKRPQFTRVGSWFCGSSLFITTQAKPSCNIKPSSPARPEAFFSTLSPVFFVVVAL